MKKADVLIIEPGQYERCKTAELFVYAGHRCPACNGTGWADNDPFKNSEFRTDVCPVCAGEKLLRAKIEVRWEPDVHREPGAFLID